MAGVGGGGAICSCRGHGNVETERKRGRYVSLEDRSGRDEEGLYVRERERSGW